MFEDIKGVIRTHQSKKDKQCNDPKKDKHDIQRKQNIEQNWPHKQRGWTQILQKGYKFLLHMWHPSYYSSYKPGDKS
jgi:hypothetical protein